MKTKTKIKALTPERRLEELHALVAICCAILNETSSDYKELSNMTGLSVSTLRRLYAGEYTLNVRFGTIQAFAAAAGLKVEFSEYDVRVNLIKE